jgi:hypothetical protein
MKAAKLKIRRKGRGRPRKEDAQRHPCGKIDQAWAQRESESEIKSVVMEARQRVYGVSDENGYSGYTLGRIFLDGKINEDQRAAGDAYAETMMRYYGAVGIPFPSPRAQSLFSIKGHDGEVTEERAKRARDASNRMMEIEGMLLRLVDGPQVKGTIYNLCVMDYENLRLMAPQQLLWAKRGLNALHHHKLLRERGKSVISSVNQSSEMPALV